MALTLDTIVNKVFTQAGNGAYDQNEVDDFLDEILEEMENREKDTENLKKQIADLNAALSKDKDEIASLNAELNTARQEAANAKSSAAARPIIEDSRSTESFEVVLNKARSAYDEIVSEAKTKADGIIRDANEEAVSIRTSAQKQITDLSDRLATARRQTSDFYDQMAALLQRQNDTMADLKRIL